LGLRSGGGNFLPLGEIRDDFEAELIEMNGEDDHVHLLALPIQGRNVGAGEQPQGCASRRLRQMHPELVRRYWKGVCRATRQTDPLTT
jgi:putative transposase